VASFSLRLDPSEKSLENWTSLAVNPAFLILLLRLQVAMASCGTVSGFGSGQIFLISSCNSWMILSTLEFEFLLKWASGRMRLMLTALSSWGGAFAIASRAGALSVLMEIDSPLRIGVVTWISPWSKSRFCSEGMKVDVV
jgi:hypothetical protein